MKLITSHQQNKETGVDLKQFKKYLLKEYGEMCHDYCWDCIVCRVWRLYEDLEGFIIRDSYE
jgi:hypothetical protein